LGNTGKYRQTERKRSPSSKKGEKKKKRCRGEKRLFSHTDKGEKTDGPGKKGRGEKGGVKRSPPPPPPEGKNPNLAIIGKKQKTAGQKPQPLPAFFLVYKKIGTGIDSVQKKKRGGGVSGGGNTSPQSNREVLGIPEKN